MINKGWYGMFSTCGMWCLADISSISPLLKQSSSVLAIEHLLNLCLFGGGVNRGKQICLSVENSMQICQSVSNSLSNPSIQDYFCSNLYTPKFGESQKQNWLELHAYFVVKLEYGKKTNTSFWIETQFKMVLELWRKSWKSDTELFRYCYSIYTFAIV